MFILRRSTGLTRRSVAESPASNFSAKSLFNSGFIKSFTAFFYRVFPETSFNHDFINTAKAVRWQFFMKTPLAYITNTDGNAILRSTSASPIGKSRFHSYSKQQIL